jgi:hypothetical protein
MTKRARIERKVWDASSQTYVGTGEVIEGEVARLEKLAPKLSNRGRYLKGPVPWEWIVAADDPIGQGKGSRQDAENQRCPLRLKMP